MSSLAELQKLIIDTLKADAAVSALVGEHVYDHPPSSGPMPRITMGPFDATPEDAECITAEEINLQIDCWSIDDGNKHPCGRIVSAAKKALHESDLELPDPYALSEIRVRQTRLFLDPDGITAHGILAVQALVEEI